MVPIRATRVLVADDHQSVREGLCALFRSLPSVDVVDDVADGDQALDRVRRLAPDVVVLDLSMPPVNGLEAMRRIKAERPDTAVVVLTRYRDHAYVREALALGASAYVLKQSPFSELSHAVNAVMRGEQYIDPRLEWTAPPGSTARVSQRELEVLRRAALGHANKDIATAFGIAVKTVEVHKASAMRKLQLRDRAEVIRYATLQGWLQEA
jgi:DNA-binding NarL/FixJ family response regulator